MYLFAIAVKLYIFCCSKCKKNKQTKKTIGKHFLTKRQSQGNSHNPNIIDLKSKKESKSWYIFFFVRGKLTIKHLVQQWIFYHLNKFHSFSLSNQNLHLPSSSLHPQKLAPKGMNRGWGKTLPSRFQNIFFTRWKCEILYWNLKYVLLASAYPRICIWSFLTEYGQNNGACCM